ncbi:MATE family efflux transporter [Coralliovum pocilloporae]|uniref:MATE family efflux transporter n=1 Tax=Coralliovum pocilloporae TaxID=3066369 RepID=UPI0033072277
MAPVSTQPADSWFRHVKSTLALGIPLVGSHLAQMLTNTTDIVMVGWYGVDELAAVVLATSVFFTVFIVGSGFAFAVLPTVANAVGANDETSVRRAVRMGFWLSMIYCALVMPPLWFVESILNLLGQEPRISAMAQDYMRIAQWSMIPALLIMVLKSYLSALERAQIVLWATVAGAVANGLANYAFIFGNWGAPEMGLRGAAVATLITTSLSFLMLWLYAARHPVLQKYDLFRRLWRSDWPAFREIYKLGWPIGLTLLAETGLFAAASLMMGWIGVRELAAHGIVLQIASIAFMIPLGLSNVATIRAGHALGRRDIPNLVRGSWVVGAVGLSIALCSLSLFLLIPETLIGLFLDKADPEAPAIVAYGLVLILAAAAFQIVDSMQVITLGLLRGIKDTSVPMALAVVSYWMIGIPVAYVFAFKQDYGGVGIWSGLVVGLTIAALTMLARYVWQIRTLVDAQSRSGELPDRTPSGIATS